MTLPTPEQTQDAQYWLDVAKWLATCHAANAADLGQLKSTSKTQRDRLKRISTRAADMLRGKWTADTSRNSPALDLYHVIGRCQKAGEP